MDKNTYSTEKSKSFRDIATLIARINIYNRLQSEIPIELLDSILDVGVTTDRDQFSSNFFEKLYPFPNRITALSDQDASWLESVYKDLKFVQSDALDMPFENNIFDLVFSSAVIEHVGCRQNQTKFISECIRVSRKHVYITTPNKYYPIELHTALPLLHWLPPDIYRSLLCKIGRSFFAEENNLNLLSKSALNEIMMKFPKVRFSIKHTSFLGFRSNLLLIITK